MPRNYKVEWNPKARRYAFRTPEGYGFLSEQKVRGIIDNDIDLCGARMGKAADTLKQAAKQFKEDNDRESYNAAVKEYRDSMATQIKAAHTGQAAAAVGGIEQMDATSHGRVGGLLKVQYRYLENACAEFAADPDLVLSNGVEGAEKRSPMYAEASRFTFERFADIADGENGKPFVINLLESGAHHCEAKKGQPKHTSCPGQTALGVLRYDDPRRICPGQRLCKTKCICGSKRFMTYEAALAALNI